MKLIDKKAQLVADAYFKEKNLEDSESITITLKTLRQNLEVAAKNGWLECASGIYLSLLSAQKTAAADKDCPLRGTPGELVGFGIRTAGEYAKGFGDLEIVEIKDE